MLFSVITFSRPGLEDPPQPEADDAITGLSCAKWVVSWLGAFGSTSFDEEPIAEDWGYAVQVRVGADTLLLACTSAFEENADRWRIAISDSYTRGLFPWTQRRRRNEAARLSAFVEQVLRAAEDVADIEVEQLG